MYCQTCGFYNANEATQCQVCGHAPGPETSAQHTRVVSDLTKYSLRAILHSLKQAKPLLALLSGPFILMFYLLNKLLRSPLFVAVSNSPTPKLQKTVFDQFPKLQKSRSFQEISAYLTGQGFTPLIDFEDVSRIEANLQRTWINEQQQVYATTYINKGRYRVTQVVFFAITTNKTYITAHNSHTLPLRYPSNMQVHAFPEMPVEQLHQEFRQLLGKLDAPPRTLPLNYLMPIGYMAHNVSVECGVRQGFFKIRSQGGGGAPCYHHATSVAVRVCATCHKGLCEACYTPYQDQYYCQTCLPEAARTKTRMQSPVADTGFAGLGVRIVAGLLDWLVIALVGAGVFFGSRYGIAAVGLTKNYGTLPIILTQLMMALFTLSYAILMLPKYGGTLGKKLLGVQVVDRQGRRPEIPAAIVRCGAHIISGLFLFPALGYLLIPFRRTKQGLHDQLAGTFVVTRHPRLKAAIAWLLVLGLFGGGGWFALPNLLPHLNLARLMIAPHKVASEIALPAKWTRFDGKNEQEQIISFALRGEQCFVSTVNGLYALNAHTGETVWENKALQSAMFQNSSDDPKRPLLVLQYQQDEKTTFSSIDPQSGKLFWTHPLEFAATVAAVDDKTILVYGGNRLQAYAPTGKLQWEKTFAAGAEFDGIRLNQDILVSQYTSEEVPILTYIERKTGKVLWDMPKSQYDLGYNLGNGYHIMGTSEGKIVLLHLPKQTVVWELPESAGYVRAHAVAPGKKKKNSDLAGMVLYTITGMIQAEDGKTIATYPSNTQFGCLTDSWVVALPTRQAQTAQAMLLDKWTGKEVTALPGEDWLNVQTVFDDETTLVLTVMQRPQDGGIAGFSQELVIITKATLTVRTVALGKNIGAAQFTFFPLERLLVMPTQRQIGGYDVPAQ